MSPSCIEISFRRRIDFYPLNVSNGVHRISFLSSCKEMVKNEGGKKKRALGLCVCVRYHKEPASSVCNYRHLSNVRCSFRLNAIVRRRRWWWWWCDAGCALLFYRNISIGAGHVSRASARRFAGPAELFPSVRDSLSINLKKKCWLGSIKDKSISFQSPKQKCKRSFKKFNITPSVEVPGFFFIFYPFPPRINFVVSCRKRANTFLRLLFHRTVLFYFYFFLGVHLFSPFSPTRKKMKAQRLDSTSACGGKKKVYKSWPVHQKETNWCYLYRPTWIWFFIFPYTSPFSLLPSERKIYIFF